MHPFCYQCIINYKGSTLCRGKEHMNFKERYFAIWQQGWGLHKKYHGIRADDEQKWSQLDKECEALDKKYEGQPEQKFVQSLLLAVVGELERESKHE